MKFQENCLFCNILSHKIKTNFLFENDLVASFYDIDPKAPNHLLIVPKIHVENIGSISKEHDFYLSAMMHMSKQIAEHFNDKEGYRLCINNGPLAGQTVFHLHMHFMSGRKFLWPCG